MPSYICLLAPSRYNRKVVWWIRVKNLVTLSPSKWLSLKKLSSQHNMFTKSWNIELKFRFYKNQAVKRRQNSFLYSFLRSLSRNFVKFSYILFREISQKSLENFAKCEIKILRNISRNFVSRYFAGHPTFHLGRVMALSSAALKIFLNCAKHICLTTA